MPRYGSDWRFSRESQNNPYAQLVGSINRTIVVYDSRVWARDIRTRLDKHFAEFPELQTIAIEYNHDNGNGPERFVAIRTDTGYAIKRMEKGGVK